MIAWPKLTFGPINLWNLPYTKEIELTNPKVLVPLGYYATKHIFKKYAIPIPPREFHKLFGKLFCAGDKKILPLQHPAALLYNLSLREEMIKNYCKMKALLIDCK